MRVQKRDRFAIWASKIIAKAQAKLHVSPQSLVLLDWDVLDANGKIRESVRGKSHSLVRNYHSMAVVTSLLPPVAPTDSKTDNGYGMYNPGAGTFAVGPGGKYAWVDGVINSYSYGSYSTNGSGISVGTGTTAESFDDYKLESPLNFSIQNGARGITYASQNVKQIWDSGDRTWTNILERAATNGGGGNPSTIDISEVGIYGYTTGYTSSEYLFVRDVLVTPVTLLPSESIVIKYTFTYQFP